MATLHLPQTRGLVTCAIRSESLVIGMVRAPGLEHSRLGPRHPTANARRRRGREARKPDVLADYFTRSMFVVMMKSR